MKYLRPVLLLLAILALGFGVKIAINHHRNPQAAGTPKEIAGSNLAAFDDATELFSKKIETVKTPEDFANALNQYMDKFESLMNSLTSDDASTSKKEERTEFFEEYNKWSIKNASAQESLWVAVQNLSVKFNTSPKAVEAYSRVEKFGKEMEKRGEEMEKRTKEVQNHTSEVLARCNKEAEIFKKEGPEAADKFHAQFWPQSYSKEQLRSWGLDDSKGK